MNKQSKRGKENKQSSPAAQQAKEMSDSAQTSKMKLIVGLGNPGKEYSGTRHNIGVMCLQSISKHYSV